LDYAQFKQLEFRRKFWKVVGADISVTDPQSGHEIGFIHMKAWKLREDIRLFTDRSRQQEILQIHARTIIDLGATYDVLAGNPPVPQFSLRRKGLKSMFVRDHWDLLDNNGNVFGELQETSSTLALARRWIEVLPFGEIVGLVFAFVPQSYAIRTLLPDGGKALMATITHRKNPFIVKMLLDTTGAQVPVHPHVTMSAGALLSVVDAAKN